jgi:hypothetical protein
MASSQITVDSAKKKEFITIFLMMPESSVINAMRQATFTEEDIADLPLRRSLQRALPGGSIKGLKAYIARQRKHPPHLPVDPAAAHPRPPMTRQYLAALTNAATYQNKKIKMIGLFSLPAVMTTTQMTTTQTTTMTQTTTKTTTTTKTMTTTALCSDDHWALNANGKMRTPLAQRVAKHRQVKPAVIASCAQATLSNRELSSGVCWTTHQCSVHERWQILTRQRSQQLQNMSWGNQRG